jgi:hypothetical protein
VVNTKRGYIVEIMFSDYIAAARQDEVDLCLVNYMNQGEGNRCIGTAMNDIAGLTISEKFRHLYIADREQDFINIFELPEIGCGYDPLVKSCGNVYRNYTSSPSCKDNAHFSFFHNTHKMCRCNTGYFYNAPEKNCLPCDASCNGHCYAAGTAGCNTFLIEKPESTILYGLTMFDTRLNFNEGFLGLTFMNGDEGKVYEINFQESTATLKKTLTLGVSEAGTPVNTTLTSDNLGNLVVMGRNIRYTSVQTPESEVVEFQYPNFDA